MSSNGPESMESDSVEDFLERFRAAWDAGDARAFAAQFTEDATYVTWLGDALTGRGEIERVHHDVFTRWSPGTRMRVRALRARPLGDGACVVVTMGGLVENGPPDFDKLQTFTLVRPGARWMCAAFQNTAMSDAAKRAYNRPACDASS